MEGASQGRSAEGSDDATALPTAEPSLASTIVLHVPNKQITVLQNIIGPALNAAGLGVTIFKSTPTLTGHFTYFVLVSASEERLLREAYRLSFPLQLDHDALRAADIARNEQLALDGVKFAVGDNEFVDKAIPTLTNDSCSMRMWAGRPLDPYSNIWAPYVPAVAHLYYVHRHTKSILNSMQRLKLLREAIEAPPDLGGAGLNLDRLVVQRKLLRWFVAHDAKEVNELRRTWARISQMPWSQPTTHIKNYLGERVAMYYVFLSFITSWMVFPAAVGLAVFIHQVYTKTPSVSYLPAYGAFVSVFTTVYVEYWKRLQSATAQAWGMSEFRKTEPMRPAFIASRSARRMRSPVTGRPDIFASPFILRARLGFTSTIVGTLLGLVVVAVGAIFWVNVLLADHDALHGGPIPQGWPAYIASIINAFQIQIFNIIYSWMARVLVDYEGHPTQSSYEQSLSIKLALFYAVNSYFSLFYIAAIKGHISINGVPQVCNINSATGLPDCMNELQQQLGILMIIRFFFAAGMELVVPWLLLRVQRIWSFIIHRAPHERQRLREIEAAKSDVERAAELTEFSVFSDYLTTIILIGYVVLFVSAFAVAPLIALGLLYLDLRFDTNKVLFLTSRPVPEGAQDIGAWMYVFEALSYLSTITNLCVVVFTNQQPLFNVNWTWLDRLTYFVIAEHAVLLLKFALSNWIPDTSFSTRLQLERQQYLVGKHVFGIPDRVELPEGPSVIAGTGGAVAPTAAGTNATVAPGHRAKRSTLGVLPTVDYDSEGDVRSHFIIYESFNDMLRANGNADMNDAGDKSDQAPPPPSTTSSSSATSADATTMVTNPNWQRTAANKGH